MLYDIMTVMEKYDKMQRGCVMPLTSCGKHETGTAHNKNVMREREQSAYHNMESCLSSAVAYHGIVSYIEYPDRGRLAF